MGNKGRIAKNTLFMYFRMLINMGVSLYTVRVILDILGEVDYGLYNVVGGVVAMFSVLSGTMASASQRFFSYELGREDYRQLQRVFSITISIYMIMIVIILLFAETIGLWFLVTRVTIPEGRADAVYLVYHLSVLSFVLTMVTVPYNALIVAREKLQVYAYVSIVEVVLKLLIVYLLVLFPFDKLKTYAVLMFCVTVIITGLYRGYCRKYFKESKYIFLWDKDLYFNILGFSFWNLFGATGAILKNHGVNVLLNIFFGPVVNASRGIAYQINNSINQLALSFSTAVNPQITKSYASGDRINMIKLIMQSAKFSYFLLLILTLPILIKTEYILLVWLKKVPEHVVIFTRLVIINALIDAIGNPLITAAAATGKIKKYQIIVGGLLIMNLPISYVLLEYCGTSPESTMIVGIIISLTALFTRAILLKKMIDFPFNTFLVSVVGIIVLSTCIAYILPIWANHYSDDTFIGLFFVTITGLISCLITIYIFGLSSSDKIYIKSILNKRFK